MGRVWTEPTPPPRPKQEPVDQLTVQCEMAVRRIRQDLDNARCRLGLPVRDYN